jgi:adenylate cyclase
MNIKNQENRKGLFAFATLFSLLIGGTMFFEGVLVDKGGWLRALNNTWADLRYNSAFYVNFFTGAGNRASYDYGFGKLILKPADPRIVIAAIDNHTLNNLGYPFPRKHYASLIEKLNRYGAKAIVMDILTIDPDKANPANDAAYVQAVKKAGNVVSSMHFDRWNVTFQTPIKGLTEASRYLAIPNMDKGIGSDNKVRDVFIFDPDAVYGDVKKLEPYVKSRGYEAVNIPGLSATAYAIYTDQPLPAVWVKYGASSMYHLNYRYPVVRETHTGWSKEKLTELSAYRWISVLDIIQGKLSKEELQVLKGAIVMIGSTAIGAYDHYPSPFMPNLPGVEVHSNALDNMLNEDFHVPVSGFLTFLLALAGIWIPVMLRKHSIPFMTSVAGGILIGGVLLDFYLTYKNYYFMFATIAFSVFVPFVVVAVYKAVMEGREKAWIKNTFGQYLSPKVVELVTKDPSRLSLGGEKRDMTAFFLDLAGFTTMSEKMSPEELTAMLVEYLSAFTDVILKHDGTVDKYIGDCIMAFWNAPLDQADHRRLGILTAIDCQNEMARLNESLTQFTIKPKCRVGVNSGPMVVGNMGSRSRLSYTVMGDTVNMASRMEGANKYFHSKIMTSEMTFGDLKGEFDHRYLGSIRVVGKAIPTKVYEPFARKGEAAPEVKTMLKHYEAGIEKFYKGDYAGSLPDFKAALAALPGDGPSQFYIDNAEKFAKEPPKGWDQSFNLTEKG